MNHKSAQHCMAVAVAAFEAGERVEVVEVVQVGRVPAGRQLAASAGQGDRRRTARRSGGVRSLTSVALAFGRGPRGRMGCPAAGGAVGPGDSRTMVSPVRPGPQGATLVPPV